MHHVPHSRPGSFRAPSPSRAPSTSHAVSTPALAVLRCPELIRFGRSQDSLPWAVDECVIESARLAAIDSAPTRCSALPWRTQFFTVDPLRLARGPRSPLLRLRLHLHQACESNASRGRGVPLRKQPHGAAGERRGKRQEGERLAPMICRGGARWFPDGTALYYVARPTQNEQVRGPDVGRLEEISSSFGGEVVGASRCRLHVWKGGIGVV